ncbi:hypothetical protein Ancab_035725, partial [Ancistrocladus abbreviatus]
VQGNGNVYRRPTSTNNCKSYKEALPINLSMHLRNIKEGERDEKDINGHPLVWRANRDRIQRLKNCQVGQTFKSNQSTQIQAWLQNEGYHGCRVRTMGGKLMLLSSDEPEELRSDSPEICKRTESSSNKP